IPAPIDIVHVHDWQVALSSLFISHQRKLNPSVKTPRTVCTIHNLAYQGICSSRDYEWTNLPWDYFTPEGIEFHGYMNCLKAGLVFSDQLTTVSPRYAREITTEALGCGLDGVLRFRQASLHGILNGVDYSEWNTEKNPFLPAPYSFHDLEGKRMA